MSLDVYLEELRPVDVFEANITHNLAAMAREAGIYVALWRPEEIPINKAGDLIPMLRDGLARLRERPEYFKRLNPDNGWGNYDGLVAFTERYLEACQECPGATIRVSR